MVSGAVEWSGTPQVTVSTQMNSVWSGKDVFLGGFGTHKRGNGSSSVRGESWEAVSWDRVRQQGRNRLG